MDFWQTNTSLAQLDFGFTKRCSTFKNGGTYDFFAPSALSTFLHKYQFDPEPAGVDGGTLDLLEGLYDKDMLAGRARKAAKDLIDKTKAHSKDTSPQNIEQLTPVTTPLRRRSPPPTPRYSAASLRVLSAFIKKEFNMDFPVELPLGVQEDDRQCLTVALKDTAVSSTSNQTVLYDGRGAQAVDDAATKSDSVTIQDSASVSRDVYDLLPEFSLSNIRH